MPLDPDAVNGAVNGLADVIEQIGKGWRWCLRRVGIDAPEPPQD